MAKRRLGGVQCFYPAPIVLIGAMVEERANYATVGDCAIMGIRPAVVAISLGEAGFTIRGILDAKAFSINIPTTEMLPLVDYFGSVSGKDVDKSELVESTPGTLPGVPLLDACPVSLECRVIEECAVEHRHIFIAEIAEAHVDERFIREADGRLGMAALQDLDPILYTLDNTYHSVGKPIGTGGKEAAEFTE